MKKRLLILLMLTGFLVVLMPERRTRAFTCTCDADFASCMQSAESVNEACHYNAWQNFQTCLFSGTYNDCYPTYEGASDLCDMAYNSAEYSCDVAYNNCLAGCEGGGGGSSGAYCNDDVQMGYHTYSAAGAGELYGNCIANGGSAFGGEGLVYDYYSTCMTNSGGTNQAACCHEAVKYNLDLSEQCHLDYRIESCHHCITP